MLKIRDILLSNPIVAAPMAGVTDLAFRQIMRVFHDGLIYSEMISCQSLRYESRRTLAAITLSPCDKPISIQLLGNDPHLMAEAACILEERGADIIDINMGCSAPKVLKQGAGGALMKTAHLAYEIVRRVVRSAGIPVTVKMRRGYGKSDESALELARAAEDAGAAAIAIHGRAVEQGFSGSSDWKIVRSAKEAVRIPVIGNGDIKSPGDAGRCMREFGCDGVMIGRASLGNPWILREAREAISGNIESAAITLGKRFETATGHIHMARQCFKDITAYKRIAKHLVWYVKGLPCSARIRELIFKKRSFDELEHLLENYHNFLSRYEAELPGLSPLDVEQLLQPEFDRD